MPREEAASMKKPTQRDLFPGALEMMILRVLKRQPMHGYALVQHIKRTSQDLLHRSKKARCIQHSNGF